MKTTVTESTDYKSYLLRLWQTSDGQERIWSASLEQPGTRQRQGFANLDDLYAFLQQQTAPPKVHDDKDKREHSQGPRSGPGKENGE